MGCLTQHTTNYLQPQRKNNPTRQVECFTNPWDFCYKSMWKRARRKCLEGEAPYKKTPTTWILWMFCLSKAVQIYSLPAEQVGFSLRGSYSNSHWNVLFAFFSMGKCKLTKLPSLKHLRCSWQWLQTRSSFLFCHNWTLAVATASFSSWDADWSWYS